jgi:hypothetical protein
MNKSLSDQDVVLDEQDLIHIDNLDAQLSSNYQVTTNKSNKRTHENLNKSTEESKTEKQRKVDQQTGVAPIIFFKVDPKLLNNKSELQNIILEMAKKDSISIRELKVTTNIDFPE